MKPILCPRCQTYNMRIKQGEDSNKRDAECTHCNYLIALKDLRNAKN